MTEGTRIEILFNSVETELERRHAVGVVPPMFIGRPVLHIHKIVKSWWQIYHEAASAATGKNRIVWERNSSYLSKSLDSTELVDSLEEIDSLIKVNLPVLKSYREGPVAEDLSLFLLQLIITYYHQVQ